jgi:exportin-1
LAKLPEIIKLLEPSQVLSFYETCGLIISAQPDKDIRQTWLLKLMELPNQMWSQIISQANSDKASLLKDSTVKSITMVLKTNVRCATSMGSAFTVQLGRIYVEMLQIYQLYSTSISDKIKAEGSFFFCFS